MSGRDGAPPSIASVCRLLDYSDEKGSYLLNRFKEQGIVDTVKSGFNDRIVVGNHLAIEDLPRDTRREPPGAGVKEIQKRQRRHEREGGVHQGPAGQKKQDLFAEIEKKLKQKMEKK